MAGFFVIDNQTGKYPDIEGIALNEDWADGLCYCDMEGFAITEDGSLILADECGRFAYCPEGRFTVAEVEGGIYDKEEIYPDCTNRRFHIPDLADICMSAEEFCCLGERKDNER